MFTLVQALLLDSFLCLADGAGLQLWWTRVDGQGKLNLAGTTRSEKCYEPTRGQVSNMVVAAENEQ